MNTNKKFTDNSLDVLQKINLSMETDNIEEIRKMSPQQRFEKLMAIIEISYLLKTAKKIAK